MRDQAVLLYICIQGQYNPANKVTMSITHRKATQHDHYTTFTIFRQSLLDFSLRTDVLEITGGQNPDQLAKTCHEGGVQRDFKYYCTQL